MVGIRRETVDFNEKVKRGIGRRRRTVVHSDCSSSCQNLKQRPAGFQWLGHIQFNRDRASHQRQQLTATRDHHNPRCRGNRNGTTHCEWGVKWCSYTNIMAFSKFRTMPADRIFVKFCLASD